MGLPASGSTTAWFDGVARTTPNSATPPAALPVSPLALSPTAGSSPPTMAHGHTAVPAAASATNGSSGNTAGVGTSSHDSGSSSSTGHAPASSSAAAAAAAAVVGSSGHDSVGVTASHAADDRRHLDGMQPSSGVGGVGGIGRGDSGHPSAGHGNGGSELAGAASASAAPAATVPASAPVQSLRRTRPGMPVQASLAPSLSQPRLGQAGGHASAGSTAVSAAPNAAAVAPTATATVPAVSSASPPTAASPPRTTGALARAPTSSASSASSGASDRAPAAGTLTAGPRTVPFTAPAARGRVEALSAARLALTNLVFVAAKVFAAVAEGAVYVPVRVKGAVFLLQPREDIVGVAVQLNTLQRAAAGVSVGDDVPLHRVPIGAVPRLAAASLAVDVATARPPSQAVVLNRAAVGTCRFGEVAVRLFVADPALFVCLYVCLFV